MRRSSARGRPARDDETRLLSLPLAYVEPRHRLGLLDDALKDKLVATRARIREVLESSEEPGVEFYDPDGCAPPRP